VIRGWRQAGDLLNLRAMWLIYALAAAVIWGVSYAASGRVIERGMSPLGFFFCYALFGAIAAAVALTLTGKLGTVPAEARGLGKDFWWFLIAIVTSAGGGLLIYMAIGEKNATLASLIEISYPVFVAIFAWVFFRETQFNLATIAGGGMILSGVAVVYLGNR
jgi:drug/metabolite transporter (DMT)-like permease